MPLTKKGKKIEEAMEKEYGEEKGKKVFYASKNKGTIKGVEKAKSKALAKSKKGSAFERQQKLISKERSEYAKKYPGTYKGRPIHELRKEAMLD